jgi:hypothetical protein
MSIQSIKSKIAGITDGGLNTALEMRSVLTDITDTYSGATGTGTTLNSVTNNGNITTNAITVSAITTNSIQLNTNPSAIPQGAGQFHWNVDEDTIDLHANGVTYQLGQEIAPTVRNISGSLIVNGTPVRFAGTQGNSGRILIVPAIADDSFPSSYILGITTEDIANNADGHVTWFGKVRAINTLNPTSGETWNDSDLLYVSPTEAGKLTNVKPEAPNPQIFMGVVVNAHVSNGEIFVRPSWRGKTTDLDDVNGTPLSGDGQLMVWDNSAQVFDFTSNISDFALTSDLTGFTTGSTLQSVTDNGSTTTNGMTINGAKVDFTVINGGDSVSITPTRVNVDASLGDSVSISGLEVSWSDGFSSSQKIIGDFTLSGTSNVITMPQATGTMALTSDIITGTTEWSTFTGTRNGGDLEVTLGDYDDSGTGTKLIVNNDTDEITLRCTEIIIPDGQLSLYNSGNQGGIRVNNITQQRLWEFPDASGTITLKDTGYTVAGLPTGSTVGDRAYVTDATVDYATAGVGVTLSGGSSNNIPVWYDGTGWVSG